MATDKELSDFLRSIEKRAWKRTAYTVRNDDAALDIVQDAMIRLAEKYSDRPPAELPLVFQRILSNATMDWFRRQKVRNAVMHNLSDFEPADGDGDFDLLEMLEAADDRPGVESAADSVARAQILLIIDGEVANLPGRQREAFLLRYWEELDVAETAQVMGCSEGSVKTHCSRAVHALAKALKARGNRAVNRITSRHSLHPPESEALQARFALRIASRLSEGAQASPPDVSERLRFAREQALQRARAARQATPAVAATGASALVLGGAPAEGSWWFKLAAVLPLAVLVLGLLEIYDLHDRSQIDAAAQIDAELLSDDLPPDAYSDPGFRRVPQVAAARLSSRSCS